MKRLLVILFFIYTATGSYAELTVFAAASTTDVMKELAALYRHGGGDTVRFNFAASGALARQIDAGAPADLFLSANVDWMDYLQARNLLMPDSRMDVAFNSLVLAAPADSGMTFEGFPANLSGRLAVGDFKSVPAGTYAEAALTSMGWLDKLQGRLIKGTNVRTVLMYVERGEVDAGIVYRTDAMQSGKVRILGTFPADSHPPIVYPAACMNTGHAEARAFLDFLHSTDAEAVWKKYGFVPVLR